MAITSYVNGAGGSTGADLAVLKRLQTSGLIYFVGNAVAGASDANSGLDRGKPLLTTAQAYANASAYDAVVLLENHDEVISSSVTLGKAGLVLAGEGTGSSKPTLTCGGAIDMLDITADAVLLDNLNFGASTAVPTSVVKANATGTTLNGLTFSCGANDTARALNLTGAAGGHFRLTNLTFTSVAATPGSAIEVTASLTGLFMDNIIFDGGSFEWSADAFLGTAAVTRLRATRMYQLNGSDVSLSTGTTGTWQQQASTGNSRFTWTV